MPVFNSFLGFLESFSWFFLEHLWPLSRSSLSPGYHNNHKFWGPLGTAHTVQPPSQTVLKTIWSEQTQPGQCPLAFMQLFPLKVLFRTIYVYCILCIYCILFTFCVSFCFPMILSAFVWISLFNYSTTHYCHLPLLQFNYCSSCWHWIAF
jgi:hypothetical protein